VKLLPVLFLCLGVQAADPLPVAAGPRDPAIRLIGRFDDRDPAGPRMAWAGSTIAVKFSGTALNVLLKTSGLDQFQVILDGTPA